MSTESNDNGRAFEYACIIELKDRIEDFRPVKIEYNTIEAAKRSWETRSELVYCPIENYNISG